MNLELALGSNLEDGDGSNLDLAVGSNLEGVLELNLEDTVGSNLEAAVGLNLETVGSNLEFELWSNPDEEPLPDLGGNALTGGLKAASWARSSTSSSEVGICSGPIPPPAN